MYLYKWTEPSSLGKFPVHFFPLLLYHILFKQSNYLVILINFIAVYIASLVSDILLNAIISPKYSGVVFFTSENATRDPLSEANFPKACLLGESLGQEKLHLLQ